ncbi:MAG: hypothetical protein M9953_04095 [Thermomicrobiales bacterium]|nr:hypothetical protein [Thermomicrobiales bacterium]MCO5224499.1 hypothetical protein [Thermomicrobiales bacterium]
MAVNYKRNRRYFENGEAEQDPRYVFGLIPILLGLIVYIPTDVPPPESVVIISNTLIIIGVIIICLILLIPNTVSRIDAEAERRLSHLKINGLKHLGLDEEAVSLVEPIMARGFLLEELGSPTQMYSKAFSLPTLKPSESSVSHAMIRVDNKSVKRSSVYEGALLCCGESDLLIYRHRFSLITQGDEQEDNFKIPFKLIRGISTDVSKHRIPGGPFRASYEDAIAITFAGADGPIFRAVVTNSESTRRSIEGLESLWREVLNNDIQWRTTRRESST